MRNTKRIKLYATSLVAMTLLAACGGDTDTNTEGTNSDVSSTTQGSTDKKVLNVQFDVEVASMDPQLATDGASFQVIASILDGLYQLDADGNPVPAIAESTDVSEDGLTYTFKLKEAMWSNGEPVTANDFVYAWRRLADPDTASEYGYIMGIAGLVNASEVLDGTVDPDQLGVVAVDDTTLEVTLANPVPFFESLMAFPSFFPMNEAFMDEVGDDYGTSPETLIANGAFKMDSYEPLATTVKLVKNEDYHDADNVTLDALNFQVIKDSQQAMLSYQNGDLDVVALAGEQVDLFKDDPEFINTQDGYVWYVSPNTLVDGLDNAKLREAMAKSINKDAIVNTALKDGSVPADFVVPIDLANGPDEKDFRATTGTFLEFDKEAAAALFEEAKEELDAEEFTFSILVEDTESAINVSQMLKSQIEENLPGVTIEIEQMPKKTRLDRMKSKDYDMGLTRWGPDYADPMTYLDLWVTGGSNNDGSWTNAEYDELVFSSQNGELSLDKEARWEALKEAEGILLDDAAVLPVYQKGSAVMIKSNVSGVDFHSVGVPRVFKNATVE
ncbi:peptide ABC transporter substrate-binding protein [Jeotgalibaca sp. MA1X17-3]|uniref:peptide ABC transporter substrate-binding protein n=1 Tax=Jeotgalibaca sp. MA1X17-3 TaxID=2908211 RepID=UPI001F20EB3A|nr:peptide ABC transporter substrate-binding protein [Jeotgalibaca sp. MA1X17-3]UJF15648.1 peptide ABC transporter substrate-binding protein [Jeotgalibaca sp. MA1X17-3]